MTRRTTQSTPCIDITVLKRAGLLVFASGFPLTWSHKDQLTALVLVEVWRDFLNISNGQVVFWMAQKVCQLRHFIIRHIGEIEFDRGFDLTDFHTVSSKLE